MNDQDFLKVIKALIPCQLDEEKGKSMYSRIIECYLHRVHGVHMSCVFYN